MSDWSGIKNVLDPTTYTFVIYPPVAFVVIFAQMRTPLNLAWIVVSVGLAVAGQEYLRKVKWKIMVSMPPEKRKKLNMRSVMRYAMGNYRKQVPIVLVYVAQFVLSMIALYTTASIVFTLPPNDVYLAPELVMFSLGVGHHCAFPVCRGDVPKGSQIGGQEVYPSSFP